MSITLSNEAAGTAEPPVQIDADRRCSEVNHRIGNSLSMIASLVRVQARNIGQRPGYMSTDEVECLLAGIGVRIEAVASLHRRLWTVPQSPTVSLCEYVNPVCEDFVATLARRGGIELSLDVDENLVVAGDAVLPMLWIVSEMVTNAIKYAHPAGSPGHIQVIGRREADGTLLLEIADDGVGLPEGFDPQTDGGFGFQLVRALAHRLGGTVSFTAPGSACSSACVSPHPHRARLFTAARARRRRAAMATAAAISPKPRGARRRWPQRKVLLRRHDRAEQQHPADVAGADDEHQQHQRPAAADAEDAVAQAHAEGLRSARAALASAR